MTVIVTLGLGGGIHTHLSTIPVGVVRNTWCCIAMRRQPHDVAPVETATHLTLPGPQMHFDVASREQDLEVGVSGHGHFELLAATRIPSLALERSSFAAIALADYTNKTQRSAARLGIFCERHKSG